MTTAEGADHVRVETPAVDPLAGMQPVGDEVRDGGNGLAPEALESSSLVSPGGPDDGEELNFAQLLRDFPPQPVAPQKAPGRWRQWLARPDRGLTAAERYLQVRLAQQGPNLRRATWIAAGLYTLLALLAWVPFNPFTSSDIPLCNCFDPAQLTWSLGWTPYAILHHVNPLFSSYIDYPQGANMATNPLMPLLGVLCAPITWLLGPIASLNVLFRVAFASSALAMFVTLRRFVASQPAAFLGGLFYGFSPYMVSEGAFHLSIAFVPLPPLILAALHDLLVAPRAGPLRSGVKLGLLCAAQYFIAQEILADTALLAAVGMLIVIASRPIEAFRTASYKLRGLGAALAVFVPLVAYPAWFETNGPGHLPRVDPFGGLLGYSLDLLSPVLPTVNEVIAPAALAARGTSLVGGNLVENGGYLGVTLIAVVIGTVVALRRDPVVRFCAVMACVGFICSLGAQLVVDNHRTTINLPMNLFGNLPVITAELAARYFNFVDLFVAILLAVTLDRIARSPLRGRLGLLWLAIWRGVISAAGASVRLGRRLRLDELVRAARLGRAAQWLRLDRVAARAGLSRLARPQVGAFVVCTAFALVPLVPRLPYHEVPSALPTAFLDSSLARQIRPGAVVLTYPYNEPPGVMAMLWASSDDYRFRLIGGYDAVPTPNDGGDPFQPPRLQPLTMVQLLDSAVTDTPKDAPPFDAATIASLQLYVRRWHVDALLFQVGGGDPQLALEYLDVAFGPPQRADGFDVWIDPRPPRHPEAPKATVRPATAP